MSIYGRPGPASPMEYNYVGELPEYNKPILVGVSAKCTLPHCEASGRHDSAAEAEKWAREHQHPVDVIELKRIWADRDG